MANDSEIVIASGISWLLHRFRREAEDRLEYLKEGIAEGIPREEYEQMVGRYKEAKRWHTFVIAEVFEEFQSAEDDALEAEPLEEMPDSE